MAGKDPDIFFADGGIDVFKMDQSGSIANMTEFFKNSNESRGSGTN